MGCCGPSRRDPSSLPPPPHRPGLCSDVISRCTGPGCDLCSQLPNYSQPWKRRNKMLFRASSPKSQQGLQGARFPLAPPRLPLQGPDLPRPGEVGATRGAVPGSEQRGSQGGRPGWGRLSPLPSTERAGAWGPVGSAPPLRGYGWCAPSSAPGSSVEQPGRVTLHLVPEVEALRQTPDPGLRARGEQRPLPV